MIRLIASDIDGTLVKDGSDGINPEIFTVIEKLKEKGIYFVAASGRQYPSLANLFAPVHDKIFFVSENGSHICTSKQKLFSFPMKIEYVREIVREVRMLQDCEILLGTADFEYVESKDASFIDLLINGYHNTIKEVPNLLEVDDAIIKVSIYHKKNAFDVAGHLIDEWSNRLKVAVAGNCWIDFMSEGVSKGAAIQIIQESLGIGQSETMAFGDQQNDVEMLQQAAYSYAVENAKPEAKRAAKYVCGKNTEDGVLQVLKQLLQELENEEK